MAKRDVKRSGVAGAEGAEGLHPLFAKVIRHAAPGLRGQADRTATPSRRSRCKASATNHSGLGEKLIAGVPARLMRPRLVFASCLIALCSFGLLMVYSASAVEALKEQGSSWYFLFRQAIFMVVGLIAFFAVSSRRVIPWRAFRAHVGTSSWLAVVILLIAVLLIGAGGDTWGASRWIPLGFFNLQPAELAKPAVIVLTAHILADYYEDASTDTPSFLLSLGACVGIPALLIYLEPDLGTLIIIAVTVLAMMYLCGISYKLIIGLGLIFAVLGGALVLSAPYRLARLLVYLDPWSDPYGDGYQATLAIMAFASGGPFGRGIGNATMKYNYLPEAHNDYILAIIGEELGFVGTALFVLVFLAMIAAGFHIARKSPSLYGQLMASGCSCALLIQFAVNSFGILGLLPMTGKPLPFISYGGSSVLTSLILAGLVFRVSVESDVKTTADRRRAGLAVIGSDGQAPPALRSRRPALPSDMRAQEDASAHVGGSTAGPVQTRSARRAADRRPSGRGASGLSPAPRVKGALLVYDGAKDARATRTSDGASRPFREKRPAPRPACAGGYGRIDLGDGAHDRLRSRGPIARVDYGDIAATPHPPRASGAHGYDGQDGTGRNPYGR